MGGEYMDEAGAHATDPNHKSIEQVTWTGAKDECSELGMNLCTLEQLCTENDRAQSVPMYKNEWEWEAQDYMVAAKKNAAENVWVNVGSKSSNNCKYTEQPSWGESEDNKGDRRHIMCCKNIVVGSFVGRDSTGPSNTGDEVPDCYTEKTDSANLRVGGENGQQEPEPAMTAASMPGPNAAIFKHRYDSVGKKQNDWTLSINSQNFVNIPVNTVVTQGTASGKLKEALNGATTSIVITPDLGEHKVAIGGEGFKCGTSEIQLQQGTPNVPQCSKLCKEYTYFTFDTTGSKCRCCVAPNPFTSDMVEHKSIAATTSKIYDRKTVAFVSTEALGILTATVTAPNILTATSSMKMIQANEFLVKSRGVEFEASLPRKICPAGYYCPNKVPPTGCSDATCPEANTNNYYDANAGDAVMRIKCANFPFNGEGSAEDENSWFNHALHSEDFGSLYNYYCPEGSFFPVRASGDLCSSDFINQDRYLASNEDVCPELQLLQEDSTPWTRVVWTFVVEPQTIAKAAGVTVTQGAATGTLKFPLNDGSDRIVINANNGVTFNAEAAIDIDGVSYTTITSVSSKAENDLSEVVRPGQVSF